MKLLERTNLKFLKRDTMLGGLVVVSVIVFTLLAIGGIMFSYSRKLKYKEASVVSQPEPPPPPVVFRASPTIPSATNILPNNGTQMPMKSFETTAVITFGGPNSVFNPDGRWVIGLAGAKSLGASQEVIIVFGIRTGKVGNRTTINSTKGNLTSWQTEVSLNNPPSWNTKGTNILTCFRKPGNLWNVYLNGYLVYENFKSASSQEPESAYYVASDLSWVSGSTNPATSLVSFS